jgi:hypothetical protein
VRFIELKTGDSWVRRSRQEEDNCCRNNEYNTLDPANTSWLVIYVHGLDEICDVGGADE